MRLSRITKHIYDQNWFAVGIDLIIVVIGVFIGIQVSNWSNDRAEMNQETVYLAELQEDFRKIVEELESDIAAYDGIVEAMSFLLAESRKVKSVFSSEDLTLAAKKLVSMVGTEIVSDTYSNLTGSGDLAIIRSREIKTSMASFFARYEVVKLVATTHELQLVNIFQPYAIANLDYVSLLPDNRSVLPAAGFSSEIIASELRSRKFRNVVAVKWDIATDLIGILDSALLDARRVQALLSKEVSQLRSSG
ncbi:hypothetical protein R0135_01200 [Congregibacter variabilis]|uniref:Uncharacterized protein n=1 Tax=Congregibacter variabilis TaxID=3081200 RepID=A0ABZ0I5C8_9GAMM|nr:hypothetical protein R0135_01200 [Congregibacter sp. IMCC43200]